MKRLKLSQLAIMGVFSPAISLQISYAEVNFRDLKGSHKFIGLAPSCQHLSPEIPIGLLRQGTLNQKFLYGNPSDPIIKLIKTAFNSVSENPSLFQVSPLAKNIAYFLSPSAIAGILGKLTSGVVTQEELKNLVVHDPGFKERVAQSNQERESAIARRDEYLAQAPVAIEIKKLEAENEQDRLSEIEIKTKESQKLREQYFPKGERDCTPGEKKEKFAAIKKDLDSIIGHFRLDMDARKRKIAELKQELSQSEKVLSLGAAINKVTYDSKNLDGFLKLILEAHHSEKAVPKRHVTEQILLSLGYLNGQDKNDLLTLYRSLPKECFSQTGWRNLFSKEPVYKAEREKFLKDQYVDSDYQKLVSRMLKKPVALRALDALANPDELAFMSYARPLLDSDALPTMSFMQIDFTHPVSGKHESMPDCVEYAILNKMLNDLAGGSGNSFNVPSLRENLKALGYEMHPDLEKFLQAYPDPSRVNEEAAHRLWATMVSGLPGVTYEKLHPDHEIDSTVSNALRVYEHLLFHKKLTDTAPSYQSLKRVEKLNLVCQVLSRPDRKISWRLKGSASENDLETKDTDLVLEFSMNGQHKYNWLVEKKHSEVNPVVGDALDWRSGLGVELAKIAVNRGNLPIGLERAIAWFLNSSELPQIYSALRAGKGSLRDFTWNVPTDSPKGKLFAIKEFLGGLDHSMIEKIGSKLPQDVTIQREYHSILAESTYYQNGKPEVSKKGSSFMRVGRVNLGGQLVLSSAWRVSGDLFWGDLVKDEETNREFSLNFEDAKLYCLNLNQSKSVREKIGLAVQKIGEDEKLIQLRRAHFHQPTEASRKLYLEHYAKLKKGSVLSGCYLPTVEDYMVLGNDLGYVEQRDEFIPQFLPGLYGRRAWSSSPSSRFEKYGLVFGGSEGGVDGDDRQHFRPFRCVCRE